MKKIIALILFVALLACMASCKKEEPPKIEEKTVYETLDELSDKSYQQIKLSIVTSKGDIELAAVYTLTASNVSFMVEQLNKLPTDGNLTGVPSNYKTAHTGTAKIVGGEVTELDGAPVTLPSYDELRGSFNFDKDNFENVFSGESSFVADVKAPSAFLGITANVQNMKLSVQFNENALVKITISYQLDGASVTTTYEFTA